MCELSDQTMAEVTVVSTPTTPTIRRRSLSVPSIAVEVQRTSALWPDEATHESDWRRVLEAFRNDPVSKPAPGSVPSHADVAEAATTSPTVTQSTAAYSAAPPAASPAATPAASTPASSAAPPNPEHTSPPSLMDTVNTLAKILKDKEQEITVLRQKLASSNDTPNPTPTSEEPKENLIVGSSLIRDFVPLDGYKIVCRPGAHPKDITRILNAKLRDNESYESITVLVGGNSVKPDTSEDIEEELSLIAQEVKEALETAAKLAKQVKVVEIPPRLPVSPTKITTLNEKIQHIAEELGADFIPCKGYFYMANGSINEALLLEDGVHPSLLGSQYLLQCMVPKIEKPKDYIQSKVAYRNRPKNPAAKSAKARSPHFQQPRTTPVHKHIPPRQAQKRPWIPKGSFTIHEPKAFQQHKPQQLRGPKHGYRHGNQHMYHSQSSQSHPRPQQQQSPGYQQQYRGPRHGAQQPHGPRFQKPRNQAYYPPSQPQQHASSYNRMGGHSYSAAPGNFTHTQRQSSNTPLNTTRCCFYCAEPGHKKLQCRHRGPVQCTLCGESGHKAKFCSR